MKTITLAAVAALLAGCMTNAQRDFSEAKNAYQACLAAKGEPACRGEKNVMDATANVYATSSHRPVPAATMTTGTVGVYRAN